MQRPDIARIIGHRGIASLAPENSLGSLREAARHGVGWVEMDVNLLADGTAVMHHDTCIAGSGGSSRWLRDMTQAELADINVAVEFDGWESEPPPRLSEVLKRLDELQMGLNLEIKDQGLDPAQVVAGLAPILASFAPERLLISSFSEALISESLRQLPQFPRGLLANRLPPGWEKTLEKLQACSMNCRWDSLEDSQIRALQEAGYLLIVWTVNDLDAGKRLLDLGVDALISDLPQQFIALSTE